MIMEQLLIFERGGTTWGVDRRHVRSFAPAGHGVAVTLHEGELLADRVVGVVEAPAGRRAGRVLRRFWPPASRGLTVVNGRVVVLIDPNAPPTALAPPEEGVNDA